MTDARRFLLLGIKQVNSDIPARQRRQSMYGGLTPKFFPLWVAGIVWFVSVAVGVTRERPVMWTWDRMVHETLPCYGWRVQVMN